MRYKITIIFANHRFLDDYISSNSRYLHFHAIKAVYNIDVDTDQQNVPAKVALAYYEANKDKLAGKWKDSTSKTYLSKVLLMK